MPRQGAVRLQALAEVGARQSVLGESLPQRLLVRVPGVRRLLTRTSGKGEQNACEQQTDC